MNAVISNVMRTQSSNPAAASKLESETVKSAEQVTGGQNTSVESSVSSKYDTLELSRKYLEYRTQSENKALQDETSQLNSTVVKKFSEDKRFLDNKKAAEEREVLEKIKNLPYFNPIYSYSEIELTEMLNDGTISRAQYDAEMAEKEMNFEAV